MDDIQTAEAQSDPQTHADDDFSFVTQADVDVAQGIICRLRGYGVSIKPTHSGAIAIARYRQLAEQAGIEAEAALWRIYPNSHNLANPDPFEGPGETYKAAYERTSELLAQNHCAMKQLAETLQTIAIGHGNPSALANDILARNSFALPQIR